MSPFYSASTWQAVFWTTGISNTVHLKCVISPSCLPVKSFSCCFKQIYDSLPSFIKGLTYHWWRRPQYVSLFIAILFSPSVFNVLYHSSQTASTRKPGMWRCIPYITFLTLNITIKQQHIYHDSLMTSWFNTIAFWNIFSEYFPKLSPIQTLSSR